LCGRGLEGELPGEVDEADLLVPGHGVGSAGVDAVVGLSDGDAVKVDLDGVVVLGKEQVDGRLNFRGGVGSGDGDGSVVVGLRWGVGIGVGSDDGAPAARLTVLVVVAERSAVERDLAAAAPSGEDVSALLEHGLVPPPRVALASVDCARVTGLSIDKCVKRNGLFELL